MNSTTVIKSSLQSVSSPAWRFRDAFTSNTCRVLFAGPHFQASVPLTKKALSSRSLPVPIEIIHAPTPSQIHNLASSAHVALPFMERFPSSFFSPSHTPHLRLVIQFGVGLEGVDSPAATAAGVAISNIPAKDTGNAAATSEHALFLCMSLSRRFPSGLQRTFRRGELGGLPLPRSLVGKRVTVVGFGCLGSTLCRYLTCMGAVVTVVRNRCWSRTSERDCPDLRRDIIKARSLREALPNTDVLVLACSMTPDTHYLMNRETIALLPRGALIVNVGRGPLVEYDAILSALKSGHVGGFASDVGVGHCEKPSEPWDPNDDLSSREDVIFTPHVGGYTDFSYDIMADRVVDAIECVVKGQPPPVWVNQC